MASTTATLKQFAPNYVNAARWLMRPVDKLLLNTSSFNTGDNG
jgi:hypothetical protein